MTYSPNDLERADRFTLANPMVSNAAVAQLIADVRREALEAAAEIADANDLPGTADQIRALKGRCAMSICRSCQRPIRWAKTESGHNIPIDVERREGAGNIQLVEQGSYLAAIVGRAGSGPWVSHFVTCPQTNGHRKERRR